MKYLIKIYPLNKTIKARKGENLFFSLSKNGIYLNTVCGGNKVCGKCYVKIISGKAEISETDKKFLSHNLLEQNYRLACALVINTNLIIEIPHQILLEQIKYLKEKKIEIKLNPVITEKVILIKPVKKTDKSLTEKLKIKNIEPVILKKMSNLKFYTKVKFLYWHNNVIDIIKPEHDYFGIAFDIGTTTISGTLINLKTGTEYLTLTKLNSQIIYGSDIITRISFSLASLNNTKKLHYKLINRINEIIDELSYKTNIDKKFIYFLVFAGNPVMNHSLLELSLKSFSSFPFNPIFKNIPAFQNKDFHINSQGMIYILPNIAGFVGGDIVGDLLTIEFKNDKIELLIDIGTNGEIVLNYKGKLFATSTAAGPAFEGFKIKFGMVAKTGAINKVYFKNGSLKIKVIDDVEPIGICGTGLIDAIAAFKRKNIITSEGKINEKSSFVFVENNIYNIDLYKKKIYLTQKDIREFQLAKGALKAGITMLLKKVNLLKKNIDSVYISGAFGSYLNVKNAMELNMLPEVSEDKIKFIGNGSLQGAKLILLDKNNIKKAESIVKKINFIELAEQKEFQDIFVDSLNFSRT